MKRIAVIFPRGKNSNPQLATLAEYDLERICDVFFFTGAEGSEKKVNKTELSLDMDMIKKHYDIIMTVEADVTKWLAGLSGGIQKFNGYPHLVEGITYIPVFNPMKTAIYPMLAKDIRKAFDTAYALARGEQVTVVQEKDYLVFDTPAELRESLLICKEKKVLICDYETADLFNVVDRNILGMSVGWKDHMGHYGPVHCWDAENIALFHEMVKDPSIMKVCHHLKFEMKWAYAKWKINPFDWANAHDTMAMKYCDNENAPVDLKSLAVQYTDLGPYEDELEKEKTRIAKQLGIKKKELSYAEIPIEVLGPYACKDIDATAQVFKKFFFCTKKYAKIYNFLMECSPAIAILETVGGLVDLGRTQQSIEDYEIILADLRKELFADENVKALVEFQKKDYNPNSVPQTRALLFDIAGLPVIKSTDKDNPNAPASTDAEVLEILAEEHGFPIARKLVELRKATKFKGTYLENIKDYTASDCRLRTGFNITRTSSGRLSSSGTINFQNIPRGKAIKQLFVEAPGYGILQMDLSTAEVFIAAAESKDDFLIEAFVSGMDFHGFIAKEAFNLPCSPNEVAELYKKDRQAAKAIR